LSRSYDGTENAIGMHVTRICTVKAWLGGAFAGAERQDLSY